MNITIVVIIFQNHFFFICVFIATKLVPVAFTASAVNAPSLNHSNQSKGSRKKGRGGGGGKVGPGAGRDSGGGWNGDF